MRVLKKAMSVFLSFVFVLVLISGAVSAKIDGAYSESIMWTFDSTSGTLTVFGDGKMKELAGLYTWDNNYMNITSVIILDGVSTISSSAFSICSNMKSISIPKSIIKICENAFENCDNLNEVFYSGTKEEWNRIDVAQLGNQYLINAKIKYISDPHVCSFGEWKIIKTPTCVDEGKRIRRCECGSEETEVIPATNNHKFEWVVYQEATCTEDGIDVKSCSVCGYIADSMMTGKLGHKTGEWETMSEATCQNEGNRAKKCLLCGIVLKEEKIAKLPHNFGEWKITVKPTEDNYGIEKRTCKSCENEEIRIIDKTLGTTPDKIFLGDANGDGQVSAKDARFILQVVAGLKSNNEIIIMNADVNGDNNITATDARVILRIVAGLEI